MTESFEFKELRAELDICGQRILLTVGEQTAQICSEILCEAKRRLELIKSGKRENAVSEAEICVFFKESIERLLGKGTVDKAFAKRPLMLDDLANLLCYIASEIRKMYEAQTRKLKQEN